MLFLPYRSDNVSRKRKWCAGINHEEASIVMAIIEMDLKENSWRFWEISVTPLIMLWYYCFRNAVVENWSKMPLPCSWISFYIYEFFFTGWRYSGNCTLMMNSLFLLLLTALINWAQCGFLVPPFIGCTFSIYFSFIFWWLS